MKVISRSVWGLALFCLGLGVRGQGPKLVNITWGNITKDSIYWQVITKNVERLWVNQEEINPKLIFKKYKLYKLRHPLSLREVEMILEKKEKKVVVKKRFPKPVQEQDFSFHMGSCLLIYPWFLRWANWRVWQKILTTMRKDSADFMVWLGDNVYLLNFHLKKSRRIIKRYLQYRKNKYLSRLLEARSNLAVWDDHDFGPNDSGSEYEKKDTTLKYFQLFWENPAYGTAQLKGTFFRYVLGNTLLLFLDTRYYRTDKHSEGNSMIGNEQMLWVERQIQQFRPRLILVFSSSQVLNEITPRESWSYYSKEKKLLYSIFEKYKVPNIIFFSGDRHRAEILKDSLYYEFTVSPITSFIRYKWSDNRKEKNNPNRIGQLMTFYNYATCFVHWDKDVNKSFTKIQIKNRKGKVKKEILLPLE